MGGKREGAGLVGAGKVQVGERGGRQTHNGKIRIKISLPYKSPELYANDCEPVGNSRTGEEYSESRMVEGAKHSVERVRTTSGGGR